MGIKMSIPEYQSMTAIGDHFGVTRNRIGQWLFNLGWRVRGEKDEVTGKRDMIPSPEALRLGLAIKLHDARNGHPGWLWHWKRTIALLEEAGH